MSCPFYGAELVGLGEGMIAPALLPTRDESCALITEQSSPCIMKIPGEEAEWSACVRNPVNNGTYFDTGIPAGDVIMAESVAEFGARLEAMGRTEEPVPDTPDTVAGKAKAARKVGQLFRDLQKVDPKSVLAGIEGSDD